MRHPSCGEKMMELGSGEAGGRLPATYAQSVPILHMGKARHRVGNGPVQNPTMLELANTEKGA